MIKLNDAIQAIIRENAFFQFDLCNRLINLTQMAQMIHPQITARTKKEVSESAILMNLSRLQRQMAKTVPLRHSFHIHNLTVYSHLGIMTFTKDEGLHQKINRLYHDILDQKGYITVTEGVSEITLIFDGHFWGKAHKVIREKPKDQQLGIAAISITFDKKFVHAPGLLYSLLQQMALQNINIIEIASTYTEFILYLDEKDIKLAFDTLFNCLKADRQ